MYINSGMVYRKYQFNCQSIVNREHLLIFGEKAFTNLSESLPLLWLSEKTSLPFKEMIGCNWILQSYSQLVNGMGHVASQMQPFNGRQRFWVMRETKSRNMTVHVEEIHKNYSRWTLQRLKQGKSSFTNLHPTTAKKYFKIAM